MQTRAFFWQALYLRWAGLLSAFMGLVSFSVLLLAFREDNPEAKLVLAVAGLVGTFVSYAIGKDIIDRVGNHENSADNISTAQVRLARIGIRFGRVLFLLFGLSILIWSLSLLIEPYIPRSPF
jgi:hydrogenase/urease accessory protein HupE